MTTELATRKAEVAFGNTPHGLDDAWRLATAIQKSGLAPSSFKTAEAILVAMQYGAELGMKPMQSLQGIAVINGKPSLYGDALMALVLDSGKCEYINERVDGTGDNAVAVCESKRKDQPQSRVSSFSVADAKKAQLWGKSGPWQSYPMRMLAMRARAFNLRDGFADVLRGMCVVEEVQDIPQNPTGGKRLELASIPDDEQTIGPAAMQPEPIIEAEVEPALPPKLLADLAACKDAQAVIFVQSQHGDADAAVIAACAARMKELSKKPKKSGTLLGDDDNTYSQG